MKISLVSDFGTNASSLSLITRKLYLELGKMMNREKSFTVAATNYSTVGIGNVNQHFDCVDIPNMGGCNFPVESILSSKNLFVGLVGIDEVVLGQDAFMTLAHWKRNKSIINEQVRKWKTKNHQISHIHASTVSDKNQFIEYLDIPEEKIEIIPYGVDHELYTSCPAELKHIVKDKICSRFFLKPAPYFIHISEKNFARKNVLRLFEAFGKAKATGIPHNLLVIGKNDDLIYEKAREIPGIVMLGYLSEQLMVNVIQGSEALILPSRHEGFGFPLVDCMACGIPSITSNVFSPPEIAQDSGLFVDPNNTDDICEKILSFVHNKKLQEELSQNALKRSQDFSWSLTAEKLFEYLKKNTETQLDFNFETDYDLAARRTIVTICNISPYLRTGAPVSDLLAFDYRKLIRWCLEVGLEDDKVSDYLTPLKVWLQREDNMYGF